MILKFTARVRYCRLLFGTPRNKVVAKINGVTRNGVPSVRASSPISIRVSSNASGRGGNK